MCIRDRSKGSWILNFFQNSLLLTCCENQPTYHICRVYLFCGSCEAVYSPKSEHRTIHKSYCTNVTICFACGKLGACAQMVACSQHPQPICVASRHEVNYRMANVLREYQLCARSMFLHIYLYCVILYEWHIVDKIIHFKVTEVGECESLFINNQGHKWIRRMNVTIQHV